MICGPCKRAGKTLTGGSSSADLRLAGFRSVRDAAEAMHRECPAVQMGAPTQCDCQHVTESVLNRPKVTA